MSKVLTVKGLQLGAGKPKIIVPLVGGTHESIISQAQSLAGQPVDMVEWRADYFKTRESSAARHMEASDMEKVLLTLSALRDILPDTPLVFTLRTKQEGGELDISAEECLALNLAVAHSGLADMVDMQVLSASAAARQDIAAMQAAGALVVGSYHDFSTTPPAEEIFSRLRFMRAVGADITKIAVMPNRIEDVLAVLNAAVLARAQLDCPFITVSMGSLGRLSRVAGGLCGSAATFGMVGQGSAPGQLAVEDLARMLDVLHHEDL